MRRSAKKYWVKDVDTVSTYPPQGTFAKSGEEIARIMARKDVSPKGVGSAIRMVQYFINRSGRKLSISRRKELELAKKILQNKIIKKKG
jgi:tRNA(adenine34) deaminase